MYRISYLLTVLLISIITCIFIFELHDKEKENKLLKSKLIELTRSIEMYNDNTTYPGKRNNLTNKKGVLE